MSDYQQKKLINIYLKLTQLDLESLTFHNRILIQDVFDMIGHIDLENHVEEKKITNDLSQNRLGVNSATIFPKVMIIDDDDELLERLKYVLSNESLKIYTFNNPVEALQNLSSIKPSVILLDFMMQEMTGFEFMHILKEKNIFKDFKIILGSIKEKEMDRTNAFKLGVHDIINKPYSIEELKFKIKKLSVKNAA